MKRLILFWLCAAAAFAQGGNIPHVGVTYAATLVSIAVTPANPTITHPDTKQFTATCTWSSGPDTDCTTTASWTSGTLGTATIGASTGLATSVAAGTSTIQAAIGGVNGSTTLTVDAAAGSVAAVQCGTAYNPGNAVSGNPVDMAVSITGVTAHNALIIPFIYFQDSATYDSVTDSTGDTVTLLATDGTAGFVTTLGYTSTNGRQAWFVVKDATAGSHTITFRFANGGSSGLVDYPMSIICEVSGQNATTPAVNATSRDVQAPLPNTVLATNSITVSTNNSLIVALAVTNGGATLSAANSYTQWAAPASNIKVFRKAENSGSDTANATIDVGQSWGWISAVVIKP